MIRTFIAFLLLSCIACRADKDDEPKPDVKSIVENGPEIPPHIDPVNLMLTHSVTEHHPGKKKDTTYYLYRPDHRLAAIKSATLSLIGTYENDVMTGMDIRYTETNEPYQRLGFEYQDGRMSHVLWLGRDAFVIYRDSIFYDAANKITGLEEFGHLNDIPGPVLTSLRRRKFIWQGNNIIEEQYQSYDGYTQRYGPLQIGTKFTYSGRKNLMNQLLPDLFQWRYFYGGDLLSEQATGSIELFNESRYFRPAGIFRYSFDEKNLTETLHYYTKDSILSSVTTTYFKLKP